MNKDVVTLQQFELGDYLVDVKGCKITRLKSTSSDKTKPTKNIPVEPKVMLLLHHLALHQGMIISQKELFKAVWPNGIFSPGSVQRCIAQLRKAFGDNASKQAVIITHPKQGYSLKLAVLEIVKNKDEHVQENSISVKPEVEQQIDLKTNKENPEVKSSQSVETSLDEKDKVPLQNQILDEDKKDLSNTHTGRWYLAFAMLLTVAILSFLLLNN